MFQFLHDLIYVYKVAPDPTTTGAEFINDRSACSGGGRWLLSSTIPPGFDAVDIGIPAHQGHQSGDLRRRIFPISAASEHKDEAYKLACWLSSADSQARILQTSHIATSKTMLETIRNATFPANSYIFADSADIARSVECPATYPNCRRSSTAMWR